MKYKIKVWKTLSRNDTGETHSHQSGISIIKEIARSGIFPILTIDSLNPRVELEFLDENGNKWKFQYIYYNDLFFGKPQSKGHDEFRLTCVKDFIREYDLKSPDEIWFALTEDNQRIIGFDKSCDSSKEDNDIIIIKKGWKMINI